MFMKLKKATTAPPRTVGADPRVCPNNNEQPACPCTPNSRADTGVCPYRWSQRHSSLFSPFYKCFLEDAKHINPAFFLRQATKAAKPSDSRPLQGALNLPFKPFMPLGSGACGTSVKQLLFLKNINPFGSFKKNTYFCAP